tara:strand:- start:730 stop:1209 length:480 start_codon:yes stop_codon:yes gene_type:complete
MKINFKKVHQMAQTPKRANPGDAGYDISSIEYVKIAPLERVLVSTGICIHIPEEAQCYARVAPRSGLSVKKGIDVMAGVIDSGYRGEIKVALVNLNKPSFDAEDPLHAINGDPNTVEINPGDRIAQLIFEKICFFDDWVEPKNFSSSERGEGGFGSTGS